MRSSNLARATAPEIDESSASSCQHPSDPLDYTPSGVRTIMAPVQRTLALTALEELAAADEAREDEEPTTEWTPRAAGNNLGAWDDAQIEALLTYEEHRDGHVSTHAEERDADTLDDSWMRTSHAPTDGGAGGHSGTLEQPRSQTTLLAASGGDWSLARWAMVGAVVLMAELGAVALFLR